MDIRVVCVGRLKERHYANACAEYLRRLGRYARVEVFEVRECGDANVEVAKRKEAEAMAGKTGSGDYFKVALDAGGKQMTSEEFAVLLKKPKITFIIGGPDGLSGGVLSQADFVLSLSRMTLPHQLARVVLLEQVYRGHTILHGGSYHK